MRNNFWDKNLAKLQSRQIVGKSMLGQTSIACKRQIYAKRRCFFPSPAYAFCFLLLLLGNTLNAQLFGLPHIERYTSANGLSNNSIMDIHQDSLGFLWVATADGLNRFDGYGFISYYREEGKPFSIAENWLHSIYETTKGDLLIGTQKEGLCLYDYNKDHFINLKPTSLSEESDLYLNLGKTILEKDQNTLLLGMNPGVVELSLGQDTSFSIFKKANLAVNCLFKSPNGDIWAGTSKGVLRYQKGPDNTFEFLENIPFSKTGAIRIIKITKKGQILIGANNGLFLLVEKAQGFDLNPIGDYKEITSIICDPKGRIWLGGKQGLSLVDGESFQSDPQEIRILKDNRLDQQYINVLYLDREQNLWIGTANNGLLRLFLSDQHFPLFRPNIQENDAGSTENITSAFMDEDGTIWLGTYGGGLLRFDRKNRSFSNFKADPYDSLSLSNNTNYSIYRDTRGTLWVGSWDGGGINKAIERGSQVFFKRFQVREGSEVDDRNINSVQQIFEDELDNLWIAANGGILKKDKNNFHFKVIKSFNIPFNSINQILEDKGGNWWIGTWNGLFVFNGEKVSRLKKDQISLPVDPDAAFYATRNDDHGLTNNRITCLHQDSKSRIWIGTYGGGLQLWNGQQEDGFAENFKAFTQKDGLPNDVIYGILEDKKQRLWLSTNNGLVLFDPDQEIFQTYTEADGLQNNQFNLHAYNYTPTGEFIFGGVNGFNVFDPLQFSIDSVLPPKVLITDFQIKGEKVKLGKRRDGTTVLEKAILTASSLQLQPYDNSFQLSFAAPTFNDATKLKYAYKLEEFDNKWQFTTHENRTALYSNLYEGEYTFLVKASVDGKNWSPIKSLAIEIAPPWYRTWWAYALGIALILLAFASVAVLAYIYSNLQNKLKFEQISRQQEAETNEMRLWFFTYISHEFRTPLTLIISPLGEMINDLTLPSKIREKLRMTYMNSKRLLRLVQQILNFRMVNSNQLKLKATQNDFVEFAREIFLTFSSHAEERNIQYDFKTDAPKAQLWFDEEKMELIIYNLLSNAFKYSNDGGNISIRINTQEEDRLSIEIKDDGIGINSTQLEHVFDPFYRAASKQYTGSGIGLALVKNLVEFHKGTIEVNSTEGQGSCFRIFLQKGNEHFTQEQCFEKAINKPRTLATKTIDATEDGYLAESPIFPLLEGKEKPQLLIVEDNPAILKYFRQHFDQEFRVLEAQDGAEGLLLAQKHIPDLIISDIMMPVLDGVSLCKKLKANIETSHIPVILLTARTALAHQLEGFESGAFEYITKPVNITVLKSRVFALLKNIIRLREHYKHQGILPSNTNQSTTEEKFLLRAAQCVEEKLTDAGFNVQDFALLMGVSRSGLHRKLQALTGKSATQFIRYIRLKHAERLLREGRTNISQTAYEVGFNDLKYFRKCFKEEFNMAPSTFLREVKAS